MIRVAIVAPTTAIRAGLSSLLGSDPEIEVIGQAGSLSDLPRSGEEADVLVVTPFPSKDFSGTGVLNDRDLFPWLGEPSSAGLLLMTDQPPFDLLSGDGSLKALGLLREDASREELLAAIHAVQEGLFVGDPTLFEQLLDRPPALANGAQIGEAEHLLTDREEQVLQLLAQGLANKQIADVLKISTHTVKFHIASIYSKMGATNRAEAVRLGLQKGFLTL